MPCVQRKGAASVQPARNRIPVGEGRLVVDDWIDDLVDELGLHDTIQPEEETQDVIPLREAVINLSITAQGWKKIRQRLFEEVKNTNPNLLQSILTADDDDLLMFLGIIQIPYLLAKQLNLSDLAAEQLAIFTLLALDIMATRGYQRGQAVEGPRETSS
jgi:hypothetical protein